MFDPGRDPRPESGLRAAATAGFELASDERRRGSARAIVGARRSRSSSARPGSSGRRARFHRPRSCALPIFVDIGDVAARGATLAVNVGRALLQRWAATTRRWRCSLAAHPIPAWLTPPAAMPAETLARPSCAGEAHGRARGDLEPARAHLTRAVALFEPSESPPPLARASWAGPIRPRWPEVDGARVRAADRGART
ncbi:MAG: hypothetical protein HS111_10585 [Kofleriaceae bacterium]|nr:hypothetical protein [Kofleriaceae bacterium]